LSELEQLQILVDQIEDVKPSHSNSGYSNPDIVQIDISMEEEYPTTEESLRNMHKDFLSMPLCAERFIISLVYFLSLKLIENTTIVHHSIEVSDRVDTEIEKEFEYLKERLKIEEPSSSDIQNSVEQVFINIKGGYWKAALSTLRKIFKKISPLNMQEMFRLIEKVDDAAQLIKGKQIILFLGGTGSGKSTTIHFLAGSRMVEKEVKGLNHIAPVEIRNSSLKNITTSPFSRSETRYITPVTVNFTDVGGYNTGSIILCDSPGFDDTSGVEVDIANGIGIVKAIKGCKSVKPVVLISYKSIGDRSEGLKKLTHVLAGMISDVEDQSRTFSYIFTKYPQNERSTIALVLDPISDNPGTILDELAESAAIDHPEEVFQFTITEKSKSAVHEQARKHQLSIMSATKRSEYLFVKYKLDQLKYL
jgi:energy-coupling factor transporter ATP-binding protein EcfA2